MLPGIHFQMTQNMREAGDSMSGKEAAWADRLGEGHAGAGSAILLLVC